MAREELENETMKQEIKPCPFCGSTARFEEGDLGFDDYVYFVACSHDGEIEDSPAGDTCSTFGPSGHTRSEAIEKWNRRPE